MLANRGLLLFLAAWLSCGCYSLVAVSSEADRGAKKGIPFFTKKSIWRQTTEYQRGYLACYLSIEGFDDEAGRARGERKFHVDAVRYAVTDEHVAIVEALEMALQTKKPVSAPLVEFLIRVPATPPGSNSLETRCVANYVERVTIVDYDNKYYLSPRAPLFGKGTFEPKLNEDGTLSTVKLEAESHPERLAELLPLKEIVGAALAVPPLALDAEALAASPELNALEAYAGTQPPPVIAITLRQERKGVRLVASYDWDQRPGRADPFDSRVVLGRLPVDGDDIVLRMLPLSSPGSERPSAPTEGVYRLSATLETPKKK